MTPSEVGPETGVSGRETREYAQNFDGANRPDSGSYICQITATSSDMRTDHRQEIIILCLGEKHVGRGELRMIRDWVRSAYLKFDPDPLGWHLTFEHHIDASRKSEECFQVRLEHADLWAARPTGRAPAREFPLQISSEAPHQSQIPGNAGFVLKAGFDFWLVCTVLMDLPGIVALRE